MPGPEHEQAGCRVWHGCETNVVGRWRLAGAVARGPDRCGGVVQGLPGGKGPVKRVHAALVTAVILVASIPATVAAGRVTKSTEQYVVVGRDAPIHGGLCPCSSTTTQKPSSSLLAAHHLVRSGHPLESDPTVSGSTETVDLTDDGTTIEPAAPSRLRSGRQRAGYCRRGDHRCPKRADAIQPQPGKTNQNDKSTGTEEGLEGSGTLTFDGSEIPVDLCSGVVGEITCSG